MKLLRVRDSSLSRDNRSLLKKNFKRKNIKEVLQNTTKAITEKVFFHPKSNVRCEFERSSFLSCPNTEVYYPTTRVRYVSSHTKVPDVTYTTTDKLRLSIHELSLKELSMVSNSIKPLDLSGEFSANREQIAAIDLTRSSNAHSNVGGLLTLIESPSPSALSPNLVEVFEEKESQTENISFCFESSFQENSKISLNDKEEVEMLSSRRHRSDETFSDRERLSDGKSTYPNSADAWLDSRGSPDQTFENSIEDTTKDQKDAFETNSENSERVDTTEKAESTQSGQEQENSEEVEKQETPFNYSIKNRIEESDSKNSKNHTEVSLLKAKRARVENIVTSIKDKPQKATTAELANHKLDNKTKSFESNSASKQQARKRKIDEKIQDLQREIASLQEECELETNYGGGVIDIDADDQNRSREQEEWNRSQKRSRNSDILEDMQHPLNSPHSDVQNGYYKGSINVALSQNGRRLALAGHVTPAMAYDVLVQSLKRELTSALVKVAEKSAKRVLEELKNTSLDQEKLMRISQQSCELDENGLEKDQYIPSLDCRRRDDDVIELTAPKKLYNSTASYMVNGKMERVRTSNQSQMCFGDVQVRREQENNNRGSPSMCSKFHLKQQENNKLDKHSFRTGIESGEQSPGSPRSNDGEIQTQALSLVKRKNSSSPHSGKSSPTRNRPFVTREMSDRYSSSPILTTEDPSNDTVKDHSRSSRISMPDDSPSDQSRVPPSPSAPGRSMQQSLFAEPRFYPPVSSVFRLPFHQDSFPSPSSVRRDPFSTSNMMKPSPFSFAPPMYPSAAHSQSVFPFSSGQLPFPLLQSYQQRTLANALADYGRFRDGFDPPASRPVSTRTSTREPSRTSNLSRTQHGSKTESLDYRNSASEVNPYSAASIQEGLTPQHLKKAKLMFFYTRYPSANTLKIYFSDVKFSRATTSQLIKWFSNFREFYYIQMEKFARQALSDGVTEISQLSVTRDSELFRVLNLHYNKSNDFRVPKEFLSATLKSLQEFFLAIQRGKDHDPSWKKVIYKVICKIDQDIPELFKSPNVLEHLDEVSN